MTMETPSISNYASASNTYTGAQALGGGIAGAGASNPYFGGLGGGGGASGAGALGGMGTSGLSTLSAAAQTRALYKQHTNQQRTTLPQREEAPMTMATTRLVQVYIADTDENVPIEQRLLYSGEQKLTDATDQELFFEIDIKGVLEAHNAKRVKLVAREVKERTEYLEPVRVRDLRMVVVDIAKF